MGSLALPPGDLFHMQCRELFEAEAVRALDATHGVFEDAARIRADARLKTPDAPDDATALRSGCALFVTGDADSRGVYGLRAVVLDDLLATGGGS